MAETIERESFNVNNLGILDTEVVGDMETLEAFLDERPVEKKEEKKEEPKKDPPKTEDKKEEVEEEVDPLEEKMEEEKETKEDEKEQQFDYEAFSKDLYQIGILTELEDEPEIKTPEDLVARLQYEKQLGATTYLDGFLSKFGDDRREMFDAIFVNGVDPKDYLPIFNNIQDFESLDITQEDAQKQVFREFFRRIGTDENTIEKRLQKSIDYGDLENDSKEFHPKLVEQDKKKLQEITNNKKAQEETQKRLDTEYKTSLQKELVKAVQAKEIKGVQITQQRANEVMDFLYTAKYKTPDGKLLTEFDKFILESKRPENIEQRILLGLLKLDNFDFSKIEKNGVSKESKNLFSELAHKSIKQKTREIETQAPATTKSTSWSKL